MNHRGPPAHHAKLATEGRPVDTFDQLDVGKTLVGSPLHCGLTEHLYTSGTSTLLHVCEPYLDFGNNSLLASCPLKSRM